jgi:hypothetical protein
MKILLRTQLVQHAKGESFLFAHSHVEQAQLFGKEFAILKRTAHAIKSHTKSACAQCVKFCN